MSPLPEDLRLPCGWVCKRAYGDELVFSYEKGDVEVAATRIDESRLLPFDLTCGWELTCRIRAGESVSERTIGRVTTRAAAVEALHVCMERVNALVRKTGSTEGLTPALITEGIELRGEIPPITPNWTARDRGHQLQLPH